MLRELAVITLLIRPQKVITDNEIYVQYRLYFALGKAYVKKNAQLEKFIFPVRKIYRPVRLKSDERRNIISHSALLV